MSIKHTVSHFLFDSSKYGCSIRSIKLYDIIRTFHRIYQNHIRESDE